MRRVRGAEPRRGLRYLDIVHLSEVRDRDRKTEKQRYLNKVEIRDRDREIDRQRDKGA